MKNILIGADPEVTLLNRRTGFTLSANRIRRYNSASSDAQIGRDGGGFLLEFRPLPSPDPFQCVYLLKKLINEVYGYGYRLSLNDGRNPAGFHIHLGVGNEYPAMNEIANMLDKILLTPLNHLEPLHRKNSCYIGKSNKWRRQPWGMEYRSLASTLLISPSVVYVIYKIAQHVAQHNGNIDFIYKSRSSWLEWIDAQVMPADEFNTAKLSWLKNKILDELEEVLSMPIADITPDKVFENWYDEELFNQAKAKKKAENIRAGSRRGRHTPAFEELSGERLVQSLHQQVISNPRLSPQDAWSDFPMEVLEIHALREYNFIGLREDRGVVVGLPPQNLPRSMELNGVRGIEWNGGSIGVPRAWRVGAQAVELRAYIVNWFRDLGEHINSIRGGR